jgi:hypothetical protein
MTEDNKIITLKDVSIADLEQAFAEALQKVAPTKSGYKVFIQSLEFSTFKVNVGLEVKGDFANRLARSQAQKAQTEAEAE